MRAVRLFSALLLIAGLCLSGRAVYLHAKAELAAVLIERAWEKSLKSDKPQPPWPWADTYPVARLTIPRLGYNEFVLEGATPRTLAFGPARLLSGARLGEQGNLILAGHRTSWFEPLEGIATGDKVEMEWRDARNGHVRKRTYTVDSIQVVEPHDLTLLAPTAEDALTLFTCYPFGRSPNSPQRFVVRASPVAIAEAQVRSATWTPFPDFTAYAKPLTTSMEVFTTSIQKAAQLGLEPKGRFSVQD